MRIAGLLLVATVATGCYHWQPTAFDEIAKTPGSRVRITTSDSLELDDARVSYGVLSGIPREHLRPIDGIDVLPPDIVEVPEVALKKLEVRKLNVLPTVILFGAIVLSVAATAFVVGGVICCHSAPVAFPPPPLR